MAGVAGVVAPIIGKDRRVGALKRAPKLGLLPIEPAMARRVNRQRS